MRKLWTLMRWAAIVVFIIVAVRNFGTEGTYLGIPYSFRLPTPSLLKERLWNPDDPRLFTPHIFGWGWAINFYTLASKLGLV